MLLPESVCSKAIQTRRGSAEAWAESMDAFSGCGSECPGAGWDTISARFRMDLILIRSFLADCTVSSNFSTLQCSSLHLLRA